MLSTDKIFSVQSSADAIYIQPHRHEDSLSMFIHNLFLYLKHLICEKGQQILI